MIYENQGSRSLEGISAVHGLGRRGGTSGSRVARVAAFTCEGLASLSRTVGFPVVAAAAVADPSRHATRLGATRHGCGTAVERKDWFEAIDFDDWLFRHYVQVPFDERWLGGCDLPFGMALDAGALAVPLPPGVHMDRFAAEFRRGLGEMRFERVAQDPGRCAHRFESGRRVVVGPRYSFVAPGEMRPVVADDLVAFHARDLRRVARIAARALVGLAIGGL